MIDRSLYRSMLNCRVIRAAAAILAAVQVAGLAGPAAAQLFGPQVTAYENARILRPDGSILDNGVMIVRGDRIVAVRASSGKPAADDRGNIRRVDVGGAVITPGLIDVTDVIANTAGAGSDASLRAADAFDRYANDAIGEALAHGVTAGFVPARGGAGINGVGAVFRFTANAGGSYGEALVEEAALCINMGSNGSPIGRLQTVDGIRKALRAALDYREAFEAYEDDLEEYEQKLKERAAKKEKEKESEGKQEEAQEQGGRGNGRPRQQGGEEGGGNGNGNNQKKEDELKKPTEPTHDASKEMLLRLIDNELPARFFAHNSEDIFNAIEIAREFEFEAIIEGAFAVGEVAEAVADVEARVILDYDSNARTGRSERTRALDRNIRAIEEAQIDWAIGTGRGAGDRGRFLLLHAQIAAQSSDRSPLALVTHDAAAMLDVAETIGRLAPGAYADFVIWSGNPLDPATQVKQVYVGGKLVYDAASAEEGASE